MGTHRPSRPSAPDIRLKSSEHDLALAPRIHPVHGRKKGRRLRAARARALTTGLRQYSIKIKQGVLSTPVFPCTLPIALEIGFGAGEHLLHQAKMTPQIGFLGAEVYQDGLAACLHQLQKLYILNHFTSSGAE